MSQQGHIRALSAEIIGRIAAGEVVERPALAIKELLENSIDAGATSITVEIEEGGIHHFRVVDNGCGIDPSDVRMAFMRHATSKLRSAEELDAIHTLGFRGEALAAIAAVSRTTMVTRKAGLEHGIKAIVEGGVIQSLQDAASPEGTSISVDDLFYNTPARQKFLKRPATEAGLVSDIVMRMILARPDIAIRLKSDGRQVYASPGNGKLSDALFSIVGREAMESMTEVKGAAAGCALHGFVGVGDASRSSRSMQTFLLNGRYVRNSFLSQALEEGCRERVMTGKYPICALQLTMPFEAIDVNVHPNKLEVRFRDERALMVGITQIVRDAFAIDPLRAAPKLFRDTSKKPEPAIPPAVASTEPDAKPPVLPPLTQPRAQQVQPSFAQNDRKPMQLSDAAKAYQRPILPGGMPPPMQQAPPATPAAEPEQITMPEDIAPTAKYTVRVIGVAWLEYVFAQMGDMLYIIDQHAAHERILYERFRTAYDQHASSQQLLVPQVVQLTHREHGALMTSLTDLEGMGFEIEDFGDRAIQVRAVPMILGSPHIKPFFGELADRISEYRVMTTDEKRRDMLVKLACRKAVKAGDPLPLSAIEQLIEEMQQTGAPPTCPHGRPLVLRVAKMDLDKRFRRIV